MIAIADKTPSDAHVSSTIFFENFGVSHLCATYLTMLFTQVPGLPRRLLPRDPRITNILGKPPNTSSGVNFPPLTFFTRDQRTSLFATRPMAREVPFSCNKVSSSTYKLLLAFFCLSHCKMLQFPKPLIVTALGFSESPLTCFLVQFPSTFI